ncbi:MAG TPA: energy transducer TonB [Kofleriaceae bacterium]|nr:energy transducer TonB [Kofleriaceae bacterium]
MFDRVIEKPARRRWKTAVIVGSAVVHGLAAAVLVVSAMWKIDKLPVAVATRIELGPRPPTGESAPAAGQKLDVQKVAKVVKPTRKLVLEPVQPQVKTDVPDVAASGTDTGGQGGGGGRGGDGTDPDAKGTCLVEPCAGIGDATEPAVEKETCTDQACRCKQDPTLAECRPPIVPPGVAKGLRTSGNEQIYPPESVKVEMLHQGKETVQGTFQLCISAGGAIDSVRVLRSTGFRSYDDELVREMRAWQYRPYKVGGVASPMCTVQVIVYRMRR